VRYLIARCHQRNRIPKVSIILGFRMIALLARWHGEQIHRGSTFQVTEDTARRHMIDRRTGRSAISAAIAPWSMRSYLCDGSIHTCAAGLHVSLTESGVPLKSAFECRAQGRSRSETHSLFSFPVVRNQLYAAPPSMNDCRLVPLFCYVCMFCESRTTTERGTPLGLASCAESLLI
jgi:hypothetical protein